MAYQLLLNVRLTPFPNRSTNAYNLPEVGGLDIHDGPPKPGPFAAYELEPPPPPRLNNKNMIITDITEQFTNAAQSTSSLSC
jgi:hypothetical protein